MTDSLAHTPPTTGSQASGLPHRFYAAAALALVSGLIALWCELQLVAPLLELLTLVVALAAGTVAAVSALPYLRSHNARRDAARTYREAVADALDDMTVTGAEVAALDRLCQEVALTGEEERQVRMQAVSEALSDYVSRRVSVREWSPDDDARIEAITKALNIDAGFSPETRDLIEQSRRVWGIRNGAPLQELPVNIRLGRGETCYQVREVQWYETRRRRTRVNYSGPTARIRLAKGVYWRIGSVDVGTTSHEELTQIDQGTLFLTNKRLLFMGTSSNKTIPLSRIVSFTSYTDGIAIQKDAGKSPVLGFTHAPEVFAAVLDRLMDER